MTKSLIILICSITLLPQVAQDANFDCEECDYPIIESSDTLLHSDTNTTLVSAMGTCPNNYFSVDSLQLCLGGKEPLNIYDFEYSRSFSCPNKKRLIQNTLALYGGGIAALGVLELLPENVTAWNKEELRNTPFFKRWWMHVKKGAVWDRDNWVFNYVLHPYGGAAYYMSARSQGLNRWQSALYSFGISTFFWEYGIEAFMEYPSVQDLIITPIIGSIIGEQFYKVKRHIVRNDYRLLGSGFLGHVVCFLVDPVNEFMGLFRSDNLHKKKSHGTIDVTSMLTPKSISINLVF